jgi:selenide,water dikinase
MPQMIATHHEAQHRPAPSWPRLPGVHALTDVTGFGLAGHALELARGARLTCRSTGPPCRCCPGVRELAAQGLVTGASGATGPATAPTWPAGRLCRRPSAPC